MQDAVLQSRSESSRRICLVSLVNRPDILDANLMRSPDVQSGRLRVLTEENPESAGRGLNRLLDRADADIIVCVHQDVYLPNGWADVLDQRLDEVEAHDPDWALIGAFGNALDGLPWGPVWSSSISAIVGSVAVEPVEVQGFDELMLVLRRSSGLRFDEEMPGFHLYGTDIAQQARAAGQGAWVLPLPLVHNDRFHDVPDEGFAQAYHYMRRKWQAVLPLEASVIKISWHGLHFWRVRWHDRRTTGERREMALDNSTDPRLIARRCGWHWV